MAVVSEDQVTLMAKRAFAHVATIGPNGEPHSSPVWVDWDGQFLRFSQTTTRQKYRNLQRDSRISLSMTDPDNDYHYVEVRGDIERIENDDGNAFINAMAKKYIDADVYPWAAPDEQRIVVYVRPEHTSGM